MTAATPRGSNASQAPAVRSPRAPTAKELQSYGSPPGEDPAGKRQTWGGATSWSEVLYRGGGRWMGADARLTRAQGGGRGLIVWVGFPGFVCKHAHVTQPSRRVPESIGKLR